MKKKLLGIIAAATVAAFALSTDSQAFKLRGRPDSKDLPKKTSASFAVSGTFSGTLAGEMKLKDTSFRIAPNTVIYVVGKGPSDSGTYVSNRSVYVSGVKENGILVARMIIIRPMESYQANKLSKVSNREAMRIPSASNPNVGEIAPGGAR